MKRINYSSGAKWEDIIGYSRAVQVGNMIEVTGTTAIDENSQVVGEDDAYLQTCYILDKIENILKKAGFINKNIIKTRIFAKNINDWPEIGKAHFEKLGEVKPATTMVEVSGLIDPAMLVEIEVTAIKE